MIDQLFIWISVALTLTVFVLMYRNQRIDAATRDELNEQKEELRNQKEALKEQHDLIQQQLQEKEVLLKEIHHRVKNNLQLVSSLLQLQSSKFSDPEVLKALEEGQGRVQSMAMIHQMLYENEDLTDINLDEYFEHLWKSIRMSFGELSNHVEIKGAKSNMHVNIDTAVPLGLIGNELLYNCFKYAFQGKEQGVIAYQFEKIEDKSYCLSMSDDGHGLPEDFGSIKKKSLGMRLVEMLSRQLDGKVEYVSDGSGTTVRVFFRLDWSE
jgi:two-component sensor histidine kinase